MTVSERLRKEADSHGRGELFCILHQIAKDFEEKPPPATQPRKSMNVGYNIDPTVPYYNSLNYGQANTSSLKPEHVTTKIDPAPAKKAFDERMDELDEVGRKFEEHFGLKRDESKVLLTVDLGPAKGALNETIDKIQAMEDAIRSHPDYRELPPPEASLFSVLEGIGRWCALSPRSRYASIYLRPNEVHLVITTHPTLAMFEMTFVDPETAETVMNILDHGIGFAADHPARHPKIVFLGKGEHRQ